MEKICRLLFFVSLCFVVITGCAEESEGNGGHDNNPENTLDTAGGDPQYGGIVRIWLGSEPNTLNPYTRSTGNASYIQYNMYNYVLTVDNDTKKLQPELAKAMPEISEDGLTYTYELREEAVWDDGKPVTGYDYEFAIKVIKNPGVNCANVRVYLEFITGVIIDPENPKRFSVTTSKKYFRALDATGALNLVPKHLYDPEGVMDKYTIPQLDELRNSEQIPEDLKAYADKFNSEPYARDGNLLQTSGPYKLESWKPGQSITLTKKKGWWGDQLAEKNPLFQAYPDKIIYKIIPDPSTALTALKSGELDVLDPIEPKEFYDYQQGKGIIPEQYNLHTPVLGGYSFIALNQRPPQSRPAYFTDKRVRRAMAHLLDMDLIIENIYYGYAEQALGPINQLKKDEYNSKLRPVPFNPKKAVELLDEAGWIDSNNDGTRDKMINGTRVEFKPVFLISTTSPNTPRVARFLQEEAKKIGVGIEIQTSKFSIILEKVGGHNFDMFAAGVSAPILPTDLKQTFHTESWENGSNFAGFGNAESDRILDDIRVELDAEKRKLLYDQIQEYIYEEQPYLFLVFPKRRLAISKRFRNARPSPVRPGFEPKKFWVSPADRIDNN